MHVEYEKTQYAPLHYILLALAVTLLMGAWVARAEPAAVIVLVGVAATLVLVALMFGSLTVRDEGDCLALRYGPLPAFRKQIRYTDITAVEPGRTSIIDGWGIHYLPGRGTTYNLWGFGCVKLSLGRKVIRVGSDDVENLVTFLRGKIGASPRREPFPS
jgi:hypothetical protein